MLPRVTALAAAMACVPVVFEGCTFPEYGFDQDSSNLDSGDADSDANGAQAGAATGGGNATGGATGGGDSGASGATGGTGGGGDDAGMPDSCERDSDCDSGQCDDLACRPVHCTNDTLDEGETDFNCGNACRPCTNGSTCELDQDCLSGRCAANQTCDEGLRIECRCTTCSEFIPSMDIQFRFDNQASSVDISLDGLEVAYYYDQDNQIGESNSCTSAEISGGCGSVSADLQSIESSDPGAKKSATFTFSGGQVDANSTSGAIQWSLDHDDDSNYSQLNDYSFQGIPQQDFGDCSRMTLQRNGELIWGTPPPPP